MMAVRGFGGTNIGPAQAYAAGLPALPPPQSVTLESELARRGGMGAPYMPFALGAHIAGGLADSLGQVATLPERWGGLTDEQKAGEALNAASWATAPGLGRAAMVGAPETDVLSMGAAADNPGIIAYHGSPHSFDQFDISKIGTGEGAQAYGHGLYFAEREGTAKSYRDTLTRGKWTYEGQPVANSTTPLDYLDKKVFDAQGPRAAIDDALGRLKNQSQFYDKVYGGGSGEANLYDFAANKLKNLDASKIGTQGSMYQVAINADPSHFLDWDKPLSEQSPKVQEALGLNKLPQKPKPEEAQAIFDLAKSRGVPAHTMPEYQELSNRLDTANGQAWDQMGIQPSNGGYARPEEMPGSTLYQAMEQGSVGPHAMSDTRSAAVAQKLREAGIPGIKYLDQGSRGAGEGTHNFVVFSDDIVNILRKYGITGLGIGTAAGLAHFKQPADEIQ
jgi:hypothetical protein